MQQIIVTQMYQRIDKFVICGRSYFLTFLKYPLESNAVKICVQFSPSNMCISQLERLIFHIPSIRSICKTVELRYYFLNVILVGLFTKTWSLFSFLCLSHLKVLDLKVGMYDREAKGFGAFTSLIKASPSCYRFALQVIGLALPLVSFFSSYLTSELD